MIVGSILFLLGIFLSAFFSGSETGFFRVTRVIYIHVYNIINTPLINDLFIKLNC